jgi:catechol 2,3-dioxygenase-like lactoylglutathione lyase family enzyme
MGLASAELEAFVPVGGVARARNFYEGVLGCEVLSTDDYGAMLRSQGTALRLARVEGDSRPPYTVLGWIVPDIQEAVQSLAATDVAFRRYEGMGQDELGIWIAPSGDRVAWFADSEGNTLSVTQMA